MTARSRRAPRVRVTRRLDKTAVDELRLKVLEMVPESRHGVAEIIRTMRLATCCSQHEYAALCGVSPRVLMAVEAGSSRANAETLAKLVRPFGYRVGIVRNGE
jgi:ribosome-binding protein aMBF1 (putative translation factor)